MSDTMLAVRKAQARSGLDVCEIPKPQPGPEDALVYVEAASICGTDLHIWRWDTWSQRRIRPPLTLGHEFCGTIVAVGDKVRQARVGDYVSAESHVTCGMCYQCRTGQAHMCPNTEILGVDRDGAFANYVVVPERVIWQNDRTKLPPEIATLQEPFGNAVFATMNQDLSGQSVAVLGCGPIGLFTVGITKAVGAKSIFASDIHPYRIELARAMGATKVFNAAPPRHPDEREGEGSSGVDCEIQDHARDGAVASGTADRKRKLEGADSPVVQERQGQGDRAVDIVSAIVDANGGYGVDVVLEMSGAGSAITTAFRVVRNGGTVILFGIPPKPVEIDVAENMIFKNLTVRALNGRRIFDTWYKTRWLLESGVVDLRPLITKTICFDEITPAMEMLSRGDACKLVLLPNGSKPPPIEQPQSGSTARRKRAHDPNISGTPVHR